MTAAMLSPLPLPHPGLTGRTGSARLRNMLPFPVSAPRPDAAPTTSTAHSWRPVPATGSTAFPNSWPAPLTVLPAASLPDPGRESAEETRCAPMPVFAAAVPAFEAVPPPPPQGLENDEDVSDFTDDDLREAFGPIVEQAVRNAVYAKENGIDTYLEPMLRATIRRALAEYAPASRPFQPPGALDRLIWHVRALFTSRTYEDIFFEKTRRFQVEEVFLLDATTLALVSFASCDPARHASVRRVASTAQRLALQLQDSTQEVRSAFDLPARRRAIARKGRYVVLVAIVHGRPGELVLSDLEFALRRIEDHFREKFQQEGSPLLYELQPFLEDCLLIQAPASTAA